MRARKPGRISTLFISLGAMGLLVVALWAAAQRRAVSKYAIPTLGPDQLWISSVPVGLPVYVSESIEAKISDKNFVGRTPTVVELEPGRRVVTVMMEDFMDELKKRGLVEVGEVKVPEVWYDVSAYSRIKMIRTDPQAGGHFDVGFTYLLRDEQKVLIALFQPENVPLDKLASLYPPGRNFVFDESAVAQELRERGIESPTTETALALLRRGGKIGLDGKTGAFVVMITGDNTFEVVERK